MCMTKIPTYGIFETIVVYIFPTNVHCDMRFLEVKIGALFCFLNGSGIAVPVFIYYKHPTRSSIVLSLYQIVAYKIVQTYLISRTILNVLHTFPRVKNVFFTEIMRFQVYKKYMCSQ